MASLWAVSLPWGWLLIVAIVGASHGTTISDEGLSRFMAIVRDARKDESLPDSPEGLPPQNWGDALKLMKPFRDGTSAYQVATKLWEATAIEGMLRNLQSVPKPPYTGDAEALIIESRLASGDTQVDYSVAYEPGMFGTLSRDARVQALAAQSPQWSLIRTFLDRKVSGDAVYNTSTVSELYLEFDETTGSAAPSVFVAPSMSFRDALMKKHFAEALRLTDPAVSDVVALLEPILLNVWSPFWSAMSWLNATQADVRKNLVGMLLHADSFSLYQVGFWLARDTGMLRIVMEGELIYEKPKLYKDTVRWWKMTRKSLKGMGWNWTDESRPGLLDEMMPRLLRGPSHFMAGLNVGAAGVLPKIGFELYFDDSVWEDAEVSMTSKQALKPFLDTAVELNLCSREKALAVRQLLGKSLSETVRYGAYRYRTGLFLNHIKVTFDPEKAVELKVYAATTWKWKNPAGVSANDEL
eukprot:TRINITY_DN57230_c0_g1_i1.p1 TRINITY_DN57230_c0_g1~~TRINITY_DN57230_c0_g1_i1.p1  ORF type:complete len:497 (-),score=58.60 TRINITY_DN57230_c0_g1_i1:69-1472(-)